MNVSKKIIEYGVAMWEKKFSDFKQTDPVSFISQLSLMKSEVAESMEFVKSLTPPQKSIMLYIIWDMLMQLELSEIDEIKSVAVAIAGTMMYQMEKYLSEKEKEGLGNFGNDLGRLVFASMIDPIIHKKEDKR